MQSLLSFPKDLEEILLSYIKKNYLAVEKARDKPFNDKDFQYFSRGAAELSAGFTDSPEDLPHNYLTHPIYRSGYLLYFLPINLLKIVGILDDLSFKTLTPGKVRILDLGSGPGTSMLGIMQAYADAIDRGDIKDAWLDFTLVDQGFGALKDAEALHRLYRDKIQQKTKNFRSDCSVKHFDLRRGGVDRFLRGVKYHYVVLSNVLEEFKSLNQKIDLVAQVIQTLVDPKKGKLIVIEPASRDSSRDLQKIRDALVVEESLATVLAPCVHQQACPLNTVNQRDWCHFYFSWQKPKFIEKVDYLIGNKKDWLQCSYMVFAPKQEETPKLRDDLWRVISNRMPSKGKEELVLCGEKGRCHLTRLDKNCGQNNLDWGKTRRGDLVIFDAQKNSTPETKSHYRDDQKLNIMPNTLFKRYVAK